MFGSDPKRAVIRGLGLEHSLDGVVRFLQDFGVRESGEDAIAIEAWIEYPSEAIRCLASCKPENLNHLNHTLKSKTDNKVSASSWTKSIDVGRFMRTIREAEAEKVIIIEGVPQTMPIGDVFNAVLGVTAGLPPIKIVSLFFKNVFENESSDFGILFEQRVADREQFLKAACGALGIEPPPPPVSSPPASVSAPPASAPAPPASTLSPAVFATLSPSTPPPADLAKHLPVKGEILKGKLAATKNRFLSDKLTGIVVGNKYKVLKLKSETMVEVQASDSKATGVFPIQCFTRFKD